MKRLILCLATVLTVLLPLLASFVRPVAVYAYSTAAITDCKKTEAGGTPGEIKSCEQGYDGAVAGKTKGQACPDSMGQGSRDPNSLSQAQCQAGYGDAGNTKAPPSPEKNPSSAAKKFCDSVEAGSAPSIAACEIGYDKGKAGASETAACGALGGGSRGSQVGSSAECDVGWEKAVHNTDPPGSGSRGGQGNSPTGGSGSGSGSTQLGCDVQFTNALTWIICPVVDAMTSIINTIDNLITDQLNVKTDAIFCDSTPTCQAYYSAWQAFRDIALGLMAIAGLVMVIAQALGMEILDAYTIRKVLPRLLIAAIAISLSWPLMRFLIQLSDDLGFGIRSLIYAPFSHLSDSLNLDFGGSAANVFFGGLGFAGAAVAVPAGVILAGGIGALLAYAGTAVLAVFVAIVVLILRQVAIIMMLLLAPIAIVAYILPNTNRLFRLWWDNFSKALLMFPLIAAFIATGRVFSAIAIHNGGAINQLIGFIAYFAPYFLIPLTFRMAGGAVGGLGNFVNQRAQGGFEGLRKARANAAQQKRAALKSGTALEGKKWIPGSIKAAGAFNTASKSIGSGWNGRYGFGARGRNARDIINQTAAAEAGQTEGVKAIAGYNDANRVLAAGMGDERAGHENLVRHLMAGGDDGKWGEEFGEDLVSKRAAAVAKADTAVKYAKVAGGFTQANGIAGFNNMVRDGTAVRDTDDLAELAATVGQGSRNNTFKYAAEGASISRQVGRSDLAAASEPIGSLAFSYSDDKFHKGLGDGTDRGVLSYKAWASGAGGEIAYTKFGSAKGRTIRNDTRKAVDILKNHQADIAAGKPSRYSADQVQFAAATLVESQTAIDQNMGKLNNRIDAAKEMAKDGGALNWYLDTGTTVADTAQVASRVSDRTPIYGSSEKRTTNREIVQKIVGDRYNSMTEDQRQQALRSGQGGGEEEN